MISSRRSFWFRFQSFPFSVALAGAIPLLAASARGDRPALVASGDRPVFRPSAGSGAGSGTAPTEVTDLRREQEQLLLENSVAEQRAKKEIAALQAESDRLTKQIDLLNKRTALKEAERKARLDAELAETREKAERARVANDLASAELAAKKRDLELREIQLRVKNAELQAQRTELDAQVAKLNSQLDLREKRDHWKNRVNVDIEYTKEPFKDGVLTLSDRRIALNGPISMETAENIGRRIHYFNNQSREFPIFIVIDNSPGGSVAAGYKIVKTMQGSAAPVYVVVKSFAASMAACIATLAKRSFAYPNAIILHHQMSGGAMGNMTEQRELLKEREEWWKRLAAPVAAKMGIGLDDFVKRMYQHRSTGDWREFADGARKLKWVDDVVDVIREQTYFKNPDAPPPSVAHHPMPLSPMIPPPRTAEVSADAPTQNPIEHVDAAGRHYVNLPRLDPVDAYYLYNPDGYYRLTH